VSGLTDALAGLASPWAYVVIGVLAALEASAFVGLFIPGELALLTGGYIVHQGHARLEVMIVVAAVAAIAGDSVGYEIGRHLGGRLRTGRPADGSARSAGTAPRPTSRPRAVAPSSSAGSSVCSVPWCRRSRVRPACPIGASWPGTRLGP
jgi:hypothetical protein